MVGVLLLCSLPRHHACPVSVAPQTLVTVPLLCLGCDGRRVVAVLPTTTSRLSSFRGFSNPSDPCGPQTECLREAAVV